MEMQHVPKAGYDILGLPVRGFSRSDGWKQWDAIKRLWISIQKVGQFFSSFKPDLVCGFGAFASAPVLIMAAWRKVPYVLHEQNAYPGLVNRIMGRFALQVFVAYDGMDRYFKPDKIKKVGNPIRQSKKVMSTVDPVLNNIQEEKVVLITGGSQGAKSINEAILQSWKLVEERRDIQWIWQCGSLYIDELRKLLGELPGNIQLVDFLADMPAVMSKADVVCARAGALTLAELAYHKKAAILIPSPNVAEDHQTKNSMAMLNSQAAHMVKDEEAAEKMIPEAIGLLENDEKRALLESNISAFASSDAAKRMVDEIEKILTV
jgi:UDP-N-acetylglucosamine--N-acetylmuramyl-(pentapeptide) pyrophosphoryl-undecaprenol N-acetylglucosamine transferase